MTKNRHLSSCRTVLYRQWWWWGRVEVSSPKVKRRERDIESGKPPPIHNGCDLRNQEMVFL